VSVEHQGRYKKIFTFWEPEESLTPYLHLCLKTWERRLPQYEIIILNYSNIDNYIPPGTYDISLLKKFTLMMQKDAVMVAVLAEQGGIFMDADTIALRDIQPIIEKLDETEAVMFSTHCAFLAARPRSYLLKLWLKNIQNKMLHLPDNGRDLKNLPWDFFSNSALESAMDEIIMSNKLAGAIQQYAVDSWAGYLKDKTKKGDRKSFRGRALLHRISNFVLARKRKMFFRTVYKKYLTMLDRVEYGFIPEARYFTSRFMEPQEKYWQFWFASNHDVKEVFTDKQTLIGLHHSWTPQWYKDFSEMEVLEHDCLLSRTLKHLLENQTTRS
jgi:hypothetical protein